MSDDLQLKDDRSGQVHIEGITELAIQDLEEFDLLLQLGEMNRFKRNTALNECSSRSHTILEVRITNQDSSDTGHARLMLCDLAGSEKFTDDQLRNKMHQIETRNINQSLSHLGRVIKALQQKGKDPKVMVPYRGSKLTRVLQNVLSGSGQSYILAALSPLA